MNLLKEYKDDETINDWIYLVSDFFSCYDREKNMFIHLPYSGGYYDQDDFLFTIWMHIRNIYNELMSDQGFISRLDKRNEYLRKNRG